MKMIGSKPEIYLDHNATTPVFPKVAEAVMTAMSDLYGNPSSSHITGLKARQILQRTRELAKSVLHVSGGEIVFNSGATEAIHTAIFSALNHVRDQHLTSLPVILYGVTEHKAVPEAIKHWKSVLGVTCEVLSIPVNSQGQIDCDFIRSFGDRLALVCTMAVNNETGVMQDLHKIESAIRGPSSSALWLVDAVQALGKMRLDFSSLSVDYASFSGHKLYCPKGVGFLYVKEGVPFVPLITGGGQEQGRRSGTENIPGIASLSVVLSFLQGSKDSPFQSESVLKHFNSLLSKTLKKSFPEIVINTPAECSVPTTINFSVRGFASKEIMDLLDAAQIRVSSGSACSSKATRSYVLDAMGVEPWRSEAAIRLSFGPVTTEAEILEACGRIESAALSLKSSCLLVNTSNEELEKVWVDGLVQIRSGDHCAHVFCSQKTKNCIIVDPIPVLCERIEHFISCQGLKVLAIFQTSEGPQDTISLLWEILKNAGQIPNSLGAGVQALPLMISLDQTTAVEMVQGDGSNQNKRAILIRDQKTGVRCCFVQDALTLSGSDLEKKLKAIINEETLICSSHDEDHMFAVNFDQLSRKRTEKHSIISCGESSAGQGVCNYNRDEIKTLLSQRDDVLFYDVREPYEFSLFKDWKKLGFERNPENVPLSRFVATLERLISENKKSAKVVFICRSGGRSEEAAKVLRRFGFTDVGYVAGGVALL